MVEDKPVLTKEHLKFYMPAIFEFACAYEWEFGEASFSITQKTLEDEMSYWLDNHELGFFISS